MIFQTKGQNGKKQKRSIVYHHQQQKTRIKVHKDLAFEIYSKDMDESERKGMMKVRQHLRNILNKWFEEIV